ncbi:hypothetical protein [Methanolapillus ohkumae]|uniref:hypothetical protein n=1 Tax=Methanolapillus ohkumae TaxID=3028298 RepID=UPI0030B8D391
MSSTQSIEILSIIFGGLIIATSMYWMNRQKDKKAKMNEIGKISEVQNNKSNLISNIFVFIFSFIFILVPILMIFQTSFLITIFFILVFIIFMIYLFNPPQ